jgi:hypothetical protein
VPFPQQQNFSGKSIAPFCTSAMSGLAGTPGVHCSLVPTVFGAVLKRLLRKIT